MLPMKEKSRKSELCSNKKLKIDEKFNRQNKKYKYNKQEN